MQDGSYVYKKEVDWSLLMEGLTLPVDNQVVFGQIMGRFLRRGESKVIHIYLNGKSYEAKIVNENFDPKYHRRKDILKFVTEETENWRGRCRHAFTGAFTT